MDIQTYTRTRHDDPIAICDALIGGERAICAFELPSGAAPDWVELMPAGDFEPRDDRAPWTNSNPDAVIAASRALRMDLPVDYEHQTEYAPQNGQPAPAAGWIKELTVRDGAIWARVEWNARARSMLEAREYRFLSPVFNFDKKTRQVTRILSAALTNTPALYFKALTRNQGKSDMDPILKAVLDALGLGEDADKSTVEQALARLQASASALATAAVAAGATGVDEPDEVAKAIAKALKAAGDGAVLKAIAKAAGLDESASADAVETAVAKAVATAAENEPDPSKFVPRSEFDQMKTALANLQKDGAEGKATASVDAAIEDGKVTPAQRDWAMAYARKDPEGFAEYIDGAPVIVAPGRTATAVKPAAGSPLTAEERAACRVTGIDPEIFKKQRDAMLAEEDA